MFIDLLCDPLVYRADRERSIHASENGIFVAWWNERVVGMDVIGTDEGVAQAGFFELLQESVRDQGTGAQIDAISSLGFQSSVNFLQLEEHICSPLSNASR